LPKVDLITNLSISAKFIEKKKIKYNLIYFRNKPQKKLVNTLKICLKKKRKKEKKLLN